MIIGSIVSPSITTNMVGTSYWFNYANRGMYEIKVDPTTLQLEWHACPPGKFVGSSPPVAVTLEPIWIDSTDVNQIPQILTPGGGWLPIVSSNFTFPPLMPLSGNIWTDTITNRVYRYDQLAMEWLDITTISPQNVISLPNMASGQFTATPSQIQPALSIKGLVEIYADGRIVYDPSYTPDKAAVALWESIAFFSPIYKEKIEELQYTNALLSKTIEQYVDAGFVLPEPKAPVDPNAAWDAAMSVII